MEAKNMSIDHVVDKVVKLLGVPYEEMNCWELAKTFYLEIYGMRLQHYFEELPEDRDERKALIYSNIGDFDRVSEPKFGDIVLFKVRGIESHIGIYLDKRHFLHTTETTGSVVEKFERWNNMLVGFYRPKLQ